MQAGAEEIKELLICSYIIILCIYVCTEYVYRCVFL